MSQCESCAMPMKKDPEGGGREADGRRSTLYCSYCYDDGEFLYPVDDVAEFQAMVVENMVKKHGWWRPVTWLATRGIPRLPRWSKKG